MTWLSVYLLGIAAQAFMFAAAIQFADRKGYPLPPAPKFSLTVGVLIWPAMMAASVVGFLALVWKRRR